MYTCVDENLSMYTCVEGLLFSWHSIPQEGQQSAVAYCHGCTFSPSARTDSQFRIILTLSMASCFHCLCLGVGASITGEFECPSSGDYWVTQLSLGRDNTPGKQNGPMPLVHLFLAHFRLLGVCSCLGGSFCTYMSHKFSLLFVSSLPTVKMVSC